MNREYPRILPEIQFCNSRGKLSQIHDSQLNDQFFYENIEQQEKKFLEELEAAVGYPVQYLHMT